ncbi:MAG: PAS domain S-box protein [Candidatus Methanoperedens sp.]|nr:PAS domain S-box protein [Candidatus Methanoperedens sp.]
MGEISTIQESKAAGNDGRSEVLLRRLTLVCIAITAGISGIAMVGWVLNMRLLTSFSPDYVPFAPGAILGLIMLSSVLFVYAFMPAHHPGLNLARGATLLVLLFCSFTLIEFFAGIEPGIEQLIFQIYEKSGAVPAVRMSPLAALNLILSACALLLLLANSGWRHAKEAASVIAVLVGMIGLITTIGYLYGTPLLYGGTIRPIAFMSAFAFIFLGVGLIAAIGTQFWPLSSFMGSTARARLLRVFLPLVVVIILFEGWLIDVIQKQPDINPALVSSLTAILFAIIFGSVINWLAQSIGGSIDRANFEKERAVDALRRSEEQFQSVAQTANDAIITSDSNGIIVFWNHGAERIFGYSADEIAGKPITLIMPERYREPHKNALSRVVSTGKNSLFGKTVELSALRKDGSEIPVELALSSWKTKEDIFFSGIVRDITERKQTDDELKKHRDHLDELVKERTIELAESEEKFKSIFDNAQEGILLVDVATKKFLIGNRMICEMLGFDEEELKNLSANDIHFEKDLPYVMQQFEKQVRKEIEVASDIPVKRKDGSIFYADIKSIPVIIGGKTYLLGNFRDITGRKHAEELKKREDRRLQSLLKISMHKPETLNDLMNMALDEVVSLSESKVGYIYYYNEKKEEFTLHAWSKNVMESCTIQKPQTTYHLQKTGIWGEAVRQRKTIIVNDFQAQNPLIKGYPEGHTPLFRFMTLPVFSNERIVAVVGVGNKETDYTDIDVLQLKQMMDSIWLIAQRQQAEESMRLAKEEAEHANMAKTNFLNTMSHELRTPLNAVLGFSELLKGKTFGELNEKQERFLDNIQTGGNNLLNIISQILDFVKMDEGTLELHIEKIPVTETLNEIISIIKEKASKKNVILEKTFDPKLMHIEADKQKLMQILIYLIDNGVKFSKPEGGTITVTAQKEGDMAKFSISDTGIGIKEEEMVHLFQKFTQLDPGLNRRYGGTGIGLAIVKHIVEQHGGKIWAESKFGEGSTFTFLIPLKASHH